MGRTVIVEDGLEHYIEALAAKKEYVIGLIFGQEVSSQKSCVIHLARTPDQSPEEDEETEDDDSVKPSRAKVKEIKDDFEEDLVLDHTRQVSTTIWKYISNYLIHYLCVLGNEIITWRNHHFGGIYCFRY